MIQLNYYAERSLLGLFYRTDIIYLNCIKHTINPGSY
jgi:hypothetical protein